MHANQKQICYNIKIMSNYTKEDADVLILDTPNRVNFEFDLLNYDVNNHSEVSHGAESIAVFRDVKKMADSFKDPKQLASVIITILSFVLIILFVILLIFYIIFKYFVPMPEKTESLKKVIIYSGGIFTMLILFYYMYNMIIIRTNILIDNTKKKQS